MSKMMKYELAVRGSDKKLHPTGIWKRGYKMGQVEDELNTVICKIGLPCVILVSPLNKPDEE